MLTDHERRLYRALTLLCEGTALADAAAQAGVTVAELAAEVADAVADLGDGPY